jgi:hypothetical protein
VSFDELDHRCMSEQEYVSGNSSLLHHTLFFFYSFFLPFFSLAVCVDATDVRTLVVFQLHPFIIYRQENCFFGRYGLNFGWLLVFDRERAGILSSMPFNHKGIQYKSSDTGRDDGSSSFKLQVSGSRFMVNENNLVLKKKQM